MIREGRGLRRAADAAGAMGRGVVDMLDRLFVPNASNRGDRSSRALGDVARPVAGP
jgi:hypothetical protein